MTPPQHEDATDSATGAGNPVGVGFGGVERRRLAEQRTAVSGGTVALEQIGAWVGPAFGRVAAVLASQRIVPTGPPFVRYFPVGNGHFDVEAGFPVLGTVERDDEVAPSTLPAGDVLVTVHAGPYDRIAEAYQRIEAWASEHSVAVRTDPWEVYLTDPSANPDPESWLTEVVVPVAAP